MPARSAIWHMVAMSSQLAAQRSGARLMVRPPSQLALNTPSLNVFGPRIGLVLRVSVMTCASRLSDRRLDGSRIGNRERLGAREAIIPGQSCIAKRAAIKECFGSTADHTATLLRLAPTLGRANGHMP